MKSLSIAFVLVASCATFSAGQQANRRPDQFYTNGESVNAWNVNSQQRVRTTLWFAKNPADSVTYRQMLAILYEDKPDKVFYVDPASRLFIGRYDLASDEFSLLPKEARKKRLEDIPDASYPAPNAPPRVAEMFDPLPNVERGNRSPLLVPPPTMEYPRLKNSTWQTSYMAANRVQLRATLIFEKNHGTYRLDRGGLGRLSNVQYDKQSNSHEIRGDWALGKSSGWFRFTVPEENLNVFWGEFGFERGQVVGAWDGYRKSSSALKESEKPVR